MSDYILQMKGIKKRFSGVIALSGANLMVKRGTVHALVGENGAGKSTLMKVLIGLYHADEGEIIFNDKHVNISSIHQALNLGISMIHQELSSIMDMRICDNVFLGREPEIKVKGFINDGKLIKNTADLFESLGIKGISPKEKMSNLSVARLQMVEIAKAVSYNSDLIIMDEPTSAISEAEVEMLFNIISSLKKKNIAIIYISHKMDEIYKITDEITVLRDGEYIGTKPTSEMTRDMLYTMMINRDLKNYFVKSKREIGNEIALEVRNLSCKGVFDDISFNVKKGEILGIAGLMGAGRTEIVESIFGLRKTNAGEIYKSGEKITINNVADAIKNKLSLATEDRKQFGLFLELPVKQNVSICYLSEICNKLLLVKKNKEIQKVTDIISALRVKTPSLAQFVKNLSGGNQQKVVLSKWLLTSPDILILDEPTRGIDVGAKTEIYNIMDNLTKQGKAIIMISSEMPEILGVSDRIIVVRGGKITGEFAVEEATQEKIIKCASY